MSIAAACLDCSQGPLPLPRAPRPPSGSIGNDGYESAFAFLPRPELLSRRSHELTAPHSRLYFVPLDQHANVNAQRRAHPPQRIRLVVPRCVHRCVIADGPDLLGPSGVEERQETRRQLQADLAEASQEVHPEHPIDMSPGDVDAHSDVQVRHPSAANC